jgi:hypothetical protein
MLPKMYLFEGSKIQPKSAMCSWNGLDLTNPPENGNLIQNAWEVSVIHG